MAPKRLVDGGLAAMLCTRPSRDRRDPMNAVRTIAQWLLIIGGLAWGYEGLADRDVFEMIAGKNHPIEVVIDVLVGLSALLVGFEMISKRD
jgi:uncharacterized membrane protein YuzA (DUF378 family)